MKSFTLQAQDHTALVSCCWENEEAQANVLLIHGMAEHSGRYYAFAEFLCRNQLRVYAFDLRAHGKTAGSMAALGIPETQTYWVDCLEDIRQQINFIRKTHPDTPLFLIGHSMGSILIRDWMSRYREPIAGCILIGTPASPGFMGLAALWIAKLEKAIKGEKAKSPIVGKMFSAAFNRYIKNPETAFDWLSRDKEQVRKYLEDNFCGFTFSSMFYIHLIEGTFRVNTMRFIKRTPDNLPLLFLSGDKDSVGAMGKGVRKAYNLYKKHGMENIEIKLFADYRHELLNETGNTAVYEYICRWIKKLYCK